MKLTFEERTSRLLVHRHTTERTNRLVKDAEAQIYFKDLSVIECRECCQVTTLYTLQNLQTFSYKEVLRKRLIQKIIYKKLLQEKYVKTRALLEHRERLRKKKHRRKNSTIKTAERGISCIKKTRRMNDNNRKL